MKRTLFLGFAVFSYVVFLGVFLYAMGFVGNLLVPKGIDDGPETATGLAIAINLGLLGLFGLQHSIMARPEFKRPWTKLIPQPIERATYCLASSACLILLFWAWRPMPGIIWDFSESPLGIVMRVLFFGGWGLVLCSSFMIDHFDLFGLRQAWLYFQGKEYTHHPFRTPFMYKYVRHPLYLGWFFAFWPAPVMTQGHLLFSIVATAYIVVATFLEERDLVGHLGEKYVDYRKTTPRYFPIPKRNSGESAPTDTTPAAK